MASCNTHLWDIDQHAAARKGRVHFFMSDMDRAGLKCHRWNDGSIGFP
jgi:hypothetical protein